MLKRKLDTLDGLDEADKRHYKQGADGKFYLQADDANELKGALDKERERADAAEAKLKGIDLEEYRRLKDDVGKREAENAKKRGDFEALEAQLKKKHKEEMDALATKLQNIQQERVASFHEAQLTKAVADAGGVAELLIPLLKASTKPEEKDGKLLLHVLGQDGNPRLKDGAGTPFGLSDLLGELKANEKLGGAFTGSGVSGAGSSPNGGRPAAGSARLRYDALMTKKDRTPLEDNELIDLGGQLQTQPKS